MDKASDAILVLKPVTFHYNNDKTNTAQFGRTRYNKTSSQFSCHFLRDAAASFLATARSTAQISHNAIANATSDRSKPMTFQKDHAPPGIYDGTCTIAKIPS